MEPMPGFKGSLFVGRDRPDGLRLKLMKDGNKIHCYLRLDEQFDNETGTILGGILFGIMDVMMWCAILLNTGKVCVTRKVRADFTVPVEPDKPYRATGRFVRVQGKDILAAAHISDAYGNVCAAVDAVFRESNGPSLEETMERLDFTGTSPEVRRIFQSLLSERRARPEETTEYYPRGPL